MCEYCEPPYKNIVGNMALQVGVFVDRHGNILFRFYDSEKKWTNTGLNKVRFCPMCGRKLKEADDGND